MGRRTTGPLGLPLFRTGEIPDGLATVTQLRLQRRRPAPGQRPAAELLYYGNSYTELWTVAETEQLPALSPGQQTAYDAARRCARCGEQRDQPVPRDHLSGRRVCAPCGEAEAEMSWWVWRHQARAAAVAWAAGVLADPHAVLVHERGVGHLLFGAFALVPATGQVLLDAPRIRYNDRDYAASTMRPESWNDPRGTVGIVDIADQVRSLAGRRLIVWTGSFTGRGLGSLIWNMRWELGEDLESALTPADRPHRWVPGVTGDELGDWYADWLSVRRPAGSWRYGRDVQAVPLPDQPDGPGGAVAHMLTLLRCMAVDDHPAGPPTCPGLRPGGREVCGAGGPLVDGLCRSCQGPLRAVAATAAGYDRG
ncbi:hypothetical protein ACN27G_06145 [Plantactinospora sp. WMMB334]|uniref:hypothetical protein n=1 Tax=Plantactinospora sp. WMMB334 TaxID=3404119 RepID=UPI003B931E4E